MLSLFSGIGAFEKALERQQIDFEVVNYCEIDKYASKAYSIIHDISESKNLGDITKVNEKDLPDFDLLTYGFPCQDISVAGKQVGITKETRSGLLFEALRIIEHKRPTVAICENVKNLVGKKFKQDFDSLLNVLKSYGYTNYWAVLNAKDYGIPQNRERVFVVSVLDGRDFKFPQPFDNGLRLKDFLEDEVDEKYYISDEKCQKLLSELKQPIDKSKPNLVGGFGEINFGKQYRQGNRVYDSESIAICLNSQPVGNMGGNSYLYAVPVLTPDRLVKRQNGRRFKTDGEPMFTLNTQDKHGVLINRGVLKEKSDGICSCIDANYHKGLDNHAARTGILSNYRIRKLTVKECFRLMGFDDDDFCKLKQANISDTQLYKMAGNSIVVDVLEGIFSNLYVNKIQTITNVI